MHRLTLVSLFIALAACTTEADTQPDRSRTESLHIEVGEVSLRVSPQVAEAAEAIDVDIASVLRTSGELISKELNSPPATVYVLFDPQGAIPEIGVGGRTQFRDGRIQIDVDLDFPDLEEALTTALPVTLAHELHHSKRIIDGPGYGDTLGSTVVTEGLADLFATEMYPNNGSQPWIDALTATERQELADKLVGVMDRRYTPTLHRRWFFGSGSLPRWTGYTLGFEIAKTYAEIVDRDAADLVTTPPLRLLKTLHHSLD